MLLEFNGVSPKAESPFFLAPGAYVIGDVALGSYSSVWFNGVLRADHAPIRIGTHTNIQDGVLIRPEGRQSCTIGNYVSVGQGTILNGCEISSRVLIGRGVIILDGAQIGSGSIITPGTIVPEFMEVPEKTVVSGRLGNEHRSVTDAEFEQIQVMADGYVAQWLEQGWQFR